MKFGITIDCIGSPRVIKISAAQYEKLVTAQANVLLTLGIEEKYDALLQNYAEFERDLLVLALEHSLFDNFDWSAGMGDLHMVNRRLANVLSMARAYIDHTPHDLNTVYGTNNEVTLAIEKAFNTAYDKSLGYRVMEAVRNHAQHNGLAIGSINYSRGWTGDIETSKALLRFRVEPILNIKAMDANVKFKQPVLTELRTAESLNASQYLREYVEQLGTVHALLRSQCSELSSWQNTILKTIQRYKKLTGGTAGLVAFKESDEDRETVNIFAEPVERLKFLQAKNRTLVNLARRYISSELR